MPVCMPISDMQRNIRAVAQQCAETGEPVYLTKNGYPSLVVMDVQSYEREKSLKELVYEREMRILSGIKAGHEQIERGEFVTLDEARKLAGTR